MILAPPVYVRRLSVAYARGPQVLRSVDTTFPAGTFTAVLGANGSGKSTLLRAVARQLPAAGEISLGDLPLASLSRRRLARRVAFLPQSPQAPDGVSVRGLVERGREPHRGAFRPLSRVDRAAVDAAMERCAVSTLAERPLASLSGGQRQRAWVALALAQDASVLLLDEPTSYLDLAHQVSALQTFRELADEGRTVVAVLHDLNLAAAFAQRCLVLASGTVSAEGTPSEVLSSALLDEAFGLAADVIADPGTGAPVILPRPHPRAEAEHASSGTALPSARQTLGKTP